MATCDGENSPLGLRREGRADRLYLSTLRTTVRRMAQGVSSKTTECRKLAPPRRQAPGMKLTVAQVCAHNEHVY